MSASILRAERDVQRAVERATACAGSDATLAAMESELWSALLGLGRAVVALFLARRAARSRPTTYEQDGRWYAFDRDVLRTSEIGTRFGKVLFSRGVGRRVGRRAPVDLPVDRELGLCSGFSLGTVTAIVQLCALMAFGTARRLFAEFHEWAPSPRATLRMVDAVGAEARRFLDDAATPEDDGEVLVIQVDGRGAPMITATEHARRRRPRRPTTGTKRHGRRLRRREHPRPRRRKGDKSKNAKVAFVGVIYTLRRTAEGWEGPINKRLIATFESHEALFKWLHKHAVRRGYGRKRCYFLADGSEHIWRYQQLYFPEAIPCIDWYHIAEKLWEAGGCLHREGSATLATWVAEQQRRLRRGKAAQMFSALSAGYSAIPKTGPGNKGRRKRLLGIMRYLGEHQHRMRYAELRRDDLDIGTGAVEGAVRNLVGLRLDGPGMRWGRDRAEMILHLRCILLNGQWTDFCRHLTRRNVRLAAQPTPTRTHDAKPQQLPKAA
ncbi:MAG: ISKra4 family transposase [Armatimonadota bacterium]